MVSFTILAGGFTSFIATYTFDSDAGTLAVKSQSQTGANPSWLTAHPTNASILYATNENSPEGSIQSYSVDTEGAVTVVDTVSSKGNGPTFTSMLSTGELTAMNYGDTVVSFPPTTAEDPLKFDTNFEAIPLPGDVHHPHMSLEVDGEVFVADLGADKVWRMKSTGTPGSFDITGSIDDTPGSGPRHLAVMPDDHSNLFIIHELSSMLTVQKIPEDPTASSGPAIASVSVVPTDVLQGTQYAAAELLISTPTEKFPDALIYVSNRNIGSTIDDRGDSIAIFKWTPPADGSSEGKLENLAQVYTGLQQIRSMAIGKVEDGGDEFIVAGANTNGGVSVFRRTEGGKNLEFVANDQTFANRSSYVWL